MAASASGPREVTMVLPDGRTISWPGTVAGKIEEGLFKVQMLDRHIKAVYRDVVMLAKETNDIDAEMDSEEVLDEFCCDLEVMRKARQYYRTGPLSEAEERSLREILDLAASAIADYETRVGPVPAYDSPLNLFSGTIPIELPQPMAKEFAALQSSPACRLTLK